MKASRYALVLLFCFQIASQILVAQQPTDTDHDGIPDTVEQSLLERFRPTFMVSGSECDLVPAAFAPNSKSPVVLKQNGTIYGQVRLASEKFPAGEGLLEVHYYHLWARDCGRRGHPLDAEHVSVLIYAPRITATPEQWRARYWFAAAHQDTVCEASSAASASTLGAQDLGAVVWISNGKHASFLSPDDCRRGCGVDRCQNMSELTSGTIINIGEANAPMNGAEWTASPAWPVAQKMLPDFDPELTAQLDSTPNAVVPISDVPGSVRSVILAGNSSVSGLAQGNQHTSNALSTAARKTWKSLRVSGSAIKKVLNTPDDKNKKEDSPNAGMSSNGSRN